MSEFTECRHDGESIISLVEQMGYSEDDMLLCKLCQKEEIEQLTAALEQAQAELQQSQDIRSDMECILSMIAKAVDVTDEPHQTWNERLLERIDQLKAALIERDNGQIRCLACKRQTYMGEEILHKSDCLLFAGEPTDD